jgi:N-acetylneuraminate lyase
MSTALHGIYPAFLTPLNEEKKFRPEVAISMLEYLLSAGVDGVYVAGTTGEGLLLPSSERRALVEAIAQVLPEDKKLFVHIGSQNIHDAMMLAEHAATHGAHAISSLPPHGSSSQVLRYYETLARQSTLPLILYYFPKAAPHAFQNPQELLEICDLPGIAGVKFTDFNFYLLQRLVRRRKLVFNGYDEALAAGLLMGAQGGIGSTYNIMPQVYLEIYRAAQRSDWETARLWQMRANCVLETMLKYPFFPALRTLMKHIGFDCGPMMSSDCFHQPQQAHQFLEEMDLTMPAEIADLIGWRSTTRR